MIVFSTAARSVNIFRKFFVILLVFGFIGSAVFPLSKALAANTYPDVVVGNTSKKFSVSYKNSGTQKVAYVSQTRANAIAWLSNSQITSGSDVQKNTGKTTYRPQDSVTRGAMAQFLFRLADSPRYIDISLNFTQESKRGISTGRAKSINWLKLTGISLGCNETGTKFCAGSAVNRGAMAQFLQKLAGVTDADLQTKYYYQPTRFSDLQETAGENQGMPLKITNSPRYYAILWLEQTGITQGCNVSRTKFCPGAPVTRGAMAEFLQKFYAQVGVSSELRKPLEQTGSVGAFLIPSNLSNYPQGSNGAEQEMEGVATGYSDQQAMPLNFWPDWRKVPGTCWNTRGYVLYKMAISTTTSIAADRNCKILEGSWSDEYSGTEMTFTNSFEVSRSLHVDHMVPKGYVYHHGASAWTKTQDKKDFVNDILNLIPARSGINISKNDKGPSEWMPENIGYWCEYSHKWIQIVKKWKITLQPVDYLGLLNVLSRCSKV